MVTLPVLAGPARGLRLRTDLVKRKDAYFWGKYDRAILEQVLPLVKPDATVWDCGTYLGYYSLVFARHVAPRGQVISIDLDSRNLERTRKHARLNGLTNLQFVNAAIGPPAGVVEFIIDEGTNSHLPGMYPGDTNMRSVWNLRDADKPRGRVKCVSFDQAYFGMNLPKPDLIKIDIEGAEKEALQHGERLFTEVRPLLLLELHNPECDRAAWDFSRAFRYDLMSLATGGILGAASDVCGTLLCRPMK
jgi:FkbM family methyltransferase